MSFYYLSVCGFLGGLLGGMGMGGGTALIPLLTIFCGVEQGVAQGINLLSFLPTSLLALSVHQKNGLLKREGLLPLVLPALVCSVLGALVASYLPALLLKKCFGFFLVSLAVCRFYAVFRKIPKKRKNF